MIAFGAGAASRGCAFLLAAVRVALPAPRDPALHQALPTVRARGLPGCDLDVVGSGSGRPGNEGFGVSCIVSLMVAGEAWHSATPGTAAGVATSLASEALRRVVVSPQREAGCTAGAAML